MSRWTRSSAPRTSGTRATALTMRSTAAAWSESVTSVPSTSIRLMRPSPSSTSASAGMSATRPATSVGSTPRSAASQARPRYSTPVSQKRYPSRAAAPAPTVDLPLDPGPSMATMSGRRVAPHAVEPPGAVVRPVRPGAVSDPSRSRSAAVSSRTSPGASSPRRTVPMRTRTRRSTAVPDLRRTSAGPGASSPGSGRPGTRSAGPRDACGHRQR